MKKYIIGLLVSILLNYHLNAQDVTTSQEEKRYQDFVAKKWKEYFEKKEKEEKKERKSNNEENEEDVEGRNLKEYLEMIDHKTLTIPYDRYNQARDSVEKIVRQTKAGRLGTTSDLIWNEQGPRTIGGRTRAAMFDPNDTQRKKVWAGGVSGGLWYNNDITDANSSWNKVDDFWESIGISDITFDPNNPSVFYVGTGEYYSNSTIPAGLWKTTNAGVSWTRITQWTEDIKKVVVDANSNVYVITTSKLSYPLGKFYKSTDGINFIEMTPPESATNFIYQDIVIGKDNNGAYNVLYLALSTATNDKVYKYGNGGLNPVKILDESISNGDGRNGRIILALDPSSQGSNQKLLYFSVVRGLKLSVNAGSSWLSLNVPSGYNSYGAYCMAVAFDPTNSNTLYIGGVSSYKSIDIGNTWNFTPAGGGDFHKFIFRSNTSDEAIILHDGGLSYKPSLSSTENGSYRRKNYVTTQFYSVDISNTVSGETVIGGMQDNSAVVFPTNYQNMTMNERQIGAGDGAYSLIDKNENQYYAAWGGGNIYFYPFNAIPQNTDIGAMDSYNNLFYVASAGSLQRYNYNSGLTLSATIQLKDNSNNIVTPSFITLNGNNLYTVSYNAYKFNGVNTANNGSTITGTLIFQNPTAFLAQNIDVGNSGNELLITSGFPERTIYYSSDGGVNWQSKPTPAAMYKIYWGVINPRNTKQVFLATEFGVWSTDDITVITPQWRLNSTDLARVRCVMLKFNEENVLAVATYGRGIFTTRSLSDGGKCTTTNMNLVSPTNDYSGTQTILHRASDYIIAKNNVQSSTPVVYQAGGYIELQQDFLANSNADFLAIILPCSTTVSARQSSEDAVSIEEEKQEVLKVYPNPATEELTIAYQVEEKGRVKLELINSNGYTVSLPIDNAEHEMGNWKTKINVSKLSSGIYFVNLYTPVQRISKKIVVVN